MVAMAEGTSATSATIAPSAATRIRSPMPFPTPASGYGRPHPLATRLRRRRRLPVVRPRRRPRELELDAVGIEEEDRVVALAVLGEVARAFRERAAQLNDPVGGCVEQLARGGLEADVVHAHPVAVDGEAGGAVGRLA